MLEEWYLYKVFRHGIPAALRALRAILRKAPLVGAAMALGFCLGGGYTIYATQRGWEEGHAIRFLILVVLAGAVAGTFVGMIVGLYVDTLMATIRGDDDRKQNRRQQVQRQK
jgi:hypothetical protein